VIAVRTTPRTWRCTVCQNRMAGTIKTCPECRTRRGTKRTSLKARADRMAAAIVKARANGKCEACGIEGRPLDWAHGWPRRHHNLRWNTEAAFALCRPCHQHFTTHPLDWAMWLIQRLGPSAQVFERRANEQWDRDYDRVLRELKEAK